ncbi:hypothetical protein BV394_09155 [Brevirhabdus pacifica]|uniref:Uncharacterized protein n=1 Tax=Brevirhabdus pacifica TaxID=1267768 RepID=A0A1U7DJ05_9RHOB|nr:RNA-binding protein [Brevirhabdus pacifica]APX89863.1 hypothetical protein BV394_09155 [Brevirhabdus pacifica]OWU74416.1 50S ribosomal protein L7 [Loktanella sp. 22II-4b]PJJ82920.1 hypothetical protein CLV77_2697 [Brevirhabdus pacifica]
MTRGGRKKDNDAPERRCIVTREVAPKERMIRFVTGPDGQVVPDLLGRLPGRGMWVTPTRDALDKAARKGGFARAARQQVTVPEDLVGMIEAALVRRLVDRISMARKAGQAVAGYEKVRGWLATGEGRVLMQAIDGSERGKTKLRPPDGKDSFIGCLYARELGLAFGRESVIHGALSAGGLTARVVDEAARLTGLREIGGDSATGKGTTDA